MAIIRRREFGKLQHYHFIYVDEFQNFANTDFHSFVAEARKFNIGLTLANQNLEQLREFRSYSGVHEQRLINAIFGNVANLVIFGVGAMDAHFLSDQIGLSAKEIMRIGRHEALAKILVNDFDTAPFTLRTEKANRLESPRNTETIETRMRESVWIEPTKVLDEIANRFSSLTKPEKENVRPDWLKPKIFKDEPLQLVEQVAERDTDEMNVEDAEQMTQAIETKPTRKGKRTKK
jgi:hypothetical protein